MINKFIPDQKPYRLFQCSKCFQYQYYLPTQKSKKCLRCGKMYLVSNLKPIDEVLGMSAALNRVKELQSQISPNSPRFVAPSEFQVTKKIRKRDQEHLYHQSFDRGSLDEEESEFINTISLLKKACSRFSSFPQYIVYIILNKIGLTPKKVDNILRRAEREFKIIGFMKKNTTYFRFNNEIQNVNN